MSCIFCKIISGEIKSPRVYEDDNVICIRDIQPQAKTHLLVVPKIHVESLDTAFPKEGGGQGELLGQMYEAAAQVARKEGLLPGGFRAIINTGKNGGQTVYHLHLHLLGGEALGEGLV